jgi:hypothetical protein
MEGAFVHREDEQDAAGWEVLGNSTSDSWPHMGGVGTDVAEGLVYILDLNAPLLHRMLEAPQSISAKGTRRGSGCVCIHVSFTDSCVHEWTGFRPRIFGIVTGRQSTIEDAVRLGWRGYGRIVAGLLLVTES